MRQRVTPRPSLGCDTNKPRNLPSVTAMGPLMQPIPATSTAPSSSSLHTGFVLAGLGSLLTAIGFGVAASATARDVGTAGWMLGIGAMMIALGALTLPARHPRVIPVLAGSSLLVGVLAMSSNFDPDYLFTAMLGYAAMIVASNRASTLARIVGGFACLFVLVAWSEKGREARDTVEALLYLFAALSAIDAFGWFAGPKKTKAPRERQASDAQRNPTMT
jgi:hypothetical protein